MGGCVGLDGVYDCRSNRKAIFNRGMILNINPNLRGRKRSKRGRKPLFEPAIFEERFHTMERVFAWEDKCRRLLLRFDRLSQLALPIQDLCLYRGGRPNSDRSISGSVNLISEWPGRLQAIVDGRFRRNLSSRSLGNLSGRVFSIDPGKPQDWRGLQPDSTTFKNPQPVACVR